MSYKSARFAGFNTTNMEMTPLQQLQQQRSATEQTLLGQQAIKTAEHDAKRSVKAESSSKGTISERDEHKGNEQSSARNRQEETPRARGGDHPSEHPYKGKHIDFSG